MRIAAYVHMQRTLLARNPTGVAKHINHMVPRLAKMPGVELTVASSQEDLEHGAIPADSPLRGLPLRPISWKRKLVELSWLFLNRPKVERWCGDVDWIYCPAEAYVAARRAKRAVTVHCVNWFESELPWYGHADTVQGRRSFAPRFRRLASDVELVLPVSEFLATRLTALFGIAPKLMRIVGNGVEDAYYTPDALSERWRAIVAGQPYVIVIGGLTRRKGGACIIEVARELLLRKSEVRIFVAGANEQLYDGPAAELSNIKMLGYVGVDTGLPELLRASTALLFPSRYETFGIPAAEALAAGTPAIVAHYAALPEVVGNAGVIVDPEQPAAIAEIIDNLARNAILRQKYIALGTERANYFRWESCVERAYLAMKEFGS